MDFFKDGSVLITASDDDSVRVYSAETGTYVCGSVCDSLIGNFSEEKVVFSKKYGIDHIRFTHAPNNVVCASRRESDDRT